MFNKIKNKLTFTLILLLLISSQMVLSSPGTEWLASHAQLDGSVQNLSEPALANDQQSTAATLAAWSHFGETGRSEWTSGVAYMESNHSGLTEEVAMLYMSKSLNGINDQELLDDLLSRVNTDGGVGQAIGFQSNVLDTALVLQALSYANQDEEVVLPILTYLVLADNNDSGYSLIAGEESSVYLSALAVDAMLPFQTLSLDIINQVQDTNKFLLQQQAPTGGWEETYLTALVIKGLVKANHPYTDYYPSVVHLRNTKQNNQHWSNDAYTTALALVAEDLTADFSDPSTNGTISGMVISSVDQQPLAGVRVVRDGLSFTEVFTNSLGQYTMTNVYAGAHNLVFNSEGYTQGDLNFSIEVGETLNLGALTLVKTPGTGIIKGTIISESSGQPIFNAQLEVDSNGSTYQTSTNRDGLYQMAIPAGPFEITASYTSFNQVKANGVLAENQTIDFSPILSNSNVGTTETQIAGRVLDANSGLPISGVDIQIPAESIQIFSDSNGEFYLEQLPMGSIQMLLTMPGYQGINIDILSGGGLVNLGDVSLVPSNEVNVSTLFGVVTESGTVDGIQGIQVEILNTALSVFTDATGAYLIENIPNENYDVLFSSPGYEPLQFTISSTEHSSTELNVQLDQAGSSALQILEFLPDRFDYIGAEEVELDIEIQNASFNAVSTRLYIRVVNEDNQIITFYPVKEVPYNGNELDASETLGARERRALVEYWNTRFQEPGDYRIELLAYDENSQNLLRTASTVITILPVKVVTGTVEFNPNVTQFDPLQDIGISAEIVNSGNAAIGEVDVTAEVYLIDKKNRSLQIESNLIDSFTDPLLTGANIVRRDSLDNVVVYSGGNNQFARFNSDETFEAMFTKNNVFDFHIDASNHVWTIDFSCQLEVYDETGINLGSYPLALNSCRDFEIMNDDENFYVVNSDGVHNFNKNTLQLDRVIGNLLEDTQGAIKHSDGRLIIADGNSGSLLQYENGSLSVWVEGLSDPHGIREDLDGTILVANYGANEIVRVDALGAMTVVNNTITTPYDIDLNPMGGYFVSSEAENRLYQLNSNGSTSVVYDSYINVPRQITNGPAGEVYIYNSVEQTIVRRLTDGSAITIATTPSPVTAMHVDTNNQLIIGMSGNVHQVENDGSLTQLSVNNSSTIKLITDGEAPGEYWLSIFDGMISKMNAAGNVTHDKFVTPFSSVKATRTNSLGEVIILGTSGSLTLLDETGTYDRFTDGSGSVMGLFISASDDMFVSKSDRNIYQVDMAGNESVYMTVDNAAQKFAIDSTGDVFYTTRGTTVYKNNGTTESVWATLNFTATGDFVIDHLDRLWISHPSNAKVSVVDASGVVTEIDTAGVLSPNSIDLIDGTDSAWISHRLGYFKLDLLGNVSDIVNSSEVSATYAIEMAVTNNAFFLMQRGSVFQYSANGLLTKKIGAFTRVLDMFNRNGELYLLTQTPLRQVLKQQNDSTLAEVIYEQTLYAMEPGLDANHLYANTYYETVEVDLVNQTQTIIVPEVNGSREKLSVSSGKLHLIDYFDNLYRVFDVSGTKELNLFGLDNIQGLTVADDGLLYLTDDANVYRFDGAGLEIIENNYVGGYIHHFANNLFKASPSGTHLFIYNTLTNESDVRSFDVVSQLKNVVFEADQDIKLISAFGLLQYGLDGTETPLVSSVSNITDVLHRQNGDVLFASSNGSRLSGITQLSGGTLTEYYTNDELFGLIPSALTESDGDVYAWSGVSSMNDLIKIDDQPRKINNPFAFGSGMSSILVIGNHLFGVNYRNALHKAELTDPVDQAPLIGDLVYSDTQSVDFSLGLQTIDFENFNSPIAGEYSIALTFSDPTINADINDTLFVGNVANGTFQIADLNVPPGNVVLDTNLLIDGLDLQKTVNLVSEEAEEIMHYDGNLQALTNYVLVDNDTVIYTEGNNDQVKKYDMVTDTHSSLFTTNWIVTDIKKDHNNDVFLVNSPDIGQIQWIDKNGNSLQIKDLGALYNFPTILYADFNSAGNLMVLGKFQSQSSYSIIEIDNNTDTLVDQWNNARYETNMWVTSNDNVYLLGAAITEINLTENHASELREYINREPGESSRNGVAVCEDTVIYSDPIIGEEEELYTDPLRRDLVYYGNNLDLFPNQNASYLADFESLMFDKEFSSLILFDHLIADNRGGGRLLKVPVNCGQMYVEVVVRDRVDTNLVGFDVAPDQIIEVANEIKEYRWIIKDLDLVQRLFNFQVQANDLLPNESRPILSEAYINFKSDLDPLQELTNPIPIPRMLGVPDRTVAVSLNQASYLAQTDVQISSTVNNTAGIAFNGTLAQHIADDQGVMVESLGAVDINALAASSQQVLNGNWNTANTFAGDYQLISYLFDELGDLQDEVITPFTIEVDETNQFSVNFNALTDQAQYNQNDTIEINATLTNVAPNGILADTILELVVTAPDTSVLLQQSGPVNTLAPNASQQWQDLVVLNDAEAGFYTITYHLKNAADVILDSFNYQFEVVIDTQLFFQGNVTVDFNDIQPGTDNFCRFELTNQSNQDLIGQEVELVVVNLSNQLTVQSTTLFININAGATWQDDLVVLTDTLSSGDHACLVRTVVNADAITQASTVFTVTGANQLSGQVFDDFNGDGLINGNDVGIENVTLNLLDVDLNVVQTISSAADGSYQFAPVFNGQYTIAVDESSVLSSAVITTGNNNSLLMVENGNQLTDFGYRYSDSSIQGIIWNDNNDDGQVGIDEDGIENVTLLLVDADMNEVDTTTTNATGSYQFNTVTSGSYHLEVTDDQMALDGLRNTTNNDPLSLEVFSHTNLTETNFGYRLDVFDLSASTTNCKKALKEGQVISYRVEITNQGNTDIEQATIENLIPVGLDNATWTCQATGGASCTAVGQGDLIDSIDVPQNGQVNYLVNATVSGTLLDVINATTNVSLPTDITDSTPENNTAIDSDMILDLHFIDGFECAAPGVPGQTNQQLLDMLIGQSKSNIGSQSVSIINMNKEGSK